jgi:hypothetical protein
VASPLKSQVREFIAFLILVILLLVLEEQGQKGMRRTKTKTRARTRRTNTIMIFCQCIMQMFLCADPGLAALDACCVFTAYMLEYYGANNYGIILNVSVMLGSS